MGWDNNEDGLIKRFYFVERNKNINIPDNGIGKVLLRRSEFVKEQIDNIIHNNITSIYYRGPTGSGKSVLLQLLGEALTAKKYPVSKNAHGGGAGGSAGDGGEFSFSFSFDGGKGKPNPKQVYLV